MSLEEVSKVEQARKLISEVIESLEKGPKGDTYYRLKRVKALLWTALKYWGE